MRAYPEQDEDELVPQAGLQGSNGWSTIRIRVYGVSIKAIINETPKNLRRYYANAGVIEIHGIPSSSNTDPFEFIQYSWINTDGRYFLADLRRQGLFRGFSGALNFQDLSAW